MDKEILYNTNISYLTKYYLANTIIFHGKGNIT